MSAKRPQSARATGFTLLELILVMLILSTVLAMAAPSLRGFFGSRQAQDTAAQMLALTQFARSQAISEGVVYRLNFDPKDRVDWLTAWKSGAFEELETEFGQVFTLPRTWPWSWKTWTRRRGRCSWSSRRKARSPRRPSG
jgi:prepilin-type N-terminal cleavage/methylation domain-containing protein